MEALERLSRLVSPLGGLISKVERLSSSPGEPAFPIAYARIDDLGRALTHVRIATTEETSGELDGSGTGLNPEQAMLRALGEALERYCSCVYSDEQFIWATATELGTEAIDLDHVPRCSSLEMAHPHCPLRAPDKSAPIRWVRGVSLMEQKPIWIPAVMVYLHCPHLGIGERFWFPISTGCAAHATIEQALVSAICEVIERDAISLVWLQQMQLPRIELDSCSPILAPYLERFHRSHVTPVLFDATTDLGIPTVYGLEVAPHNSALATLVMCATDLEPTQAVTKVLREATPARIALQLPRPLPDSTDQFNSVFHGAVYMGSPAHHRDFGFLLSSHATRKLADMPRPATGSPLGDLLFLLRRLQDHGMTAYAVDLTTDEALRSGMRVVRVIVPQLQPLSFSTRARFLGHPRLYEAPLRMGHPVRPEGDLNPLPQPFA